jgi:integrase
MAAVVAPVRYPPSHKPPRASTKSLWVFCDRTGEPLRKENFIRRSFRPLLEAAKLPVIRFHDLRHSAATRMLIQGIHPKIVADILGHASVQVTLDTYSHVLPSMGREAADEFDQLAR